MSNKNNARIIHKHDTQANWEKAVNFIPLDGELIAYDVDDAHPTPRIKIGDGVTNVNSLPFATNVILYGSSYPTNSQGSDGDIYVKYE